MPKQNETMQHDTYELYMRRGRIPCDFSTPPSNKVSYASTNEIGTYMRQGRFATMHVGTELLNYDKVRSDSLSKVSHWF